ncbi:LysR family transcriptional regulator [Gemmata sp. G18]|uniref:LysR family transcriptional regulator n=1 Tax=Gemmata palustris TaxID=2822762 RepID=A0ABS5BQP7_9BACT|nr:LysR family transcriptional regulator [Gemmata palustris]MBP3956014.1 LysR family transcriptional regulator [Gemmata palustris]
MPTDKSRWGLKTRIWVERDGRKVLGPGRVELLEHITREQSISAAAKKMQMSYRRAWTLVQDMNEAAGVALVESSTGGTGGGGAIVTPHGHEAIRLYRALAAQIAQTVAGAPLSVDPLAAPAASG